MSKYQSNTAGRLFLFFDAIFPFDKDSLATEVVSARLGLSWTEDWLEVMRAGVDYMDGWNEVERTLADDGSQHSAIVLKTLGQTRRVLERFPVIGSQNMGHFMKGLDAAGVQCLETAWAELDRIQREVVLQRAQVDDLLSQLDSLIEVLDSIEPIDAELSREIRYHLNAVRHALMRLDISGSRAVGREVAALIGAVWQRPGAAATLEKSDWIKKAGAFVFAVDLLLNLGANAQALEAGSQGNTVVSQFIEIPAETQQSVADRVHELRASEPSDPSSYESQAGTAHD